MNSPFVANTCKTEGVAWKFNREMTVEKSLQRAAGADISMVFNLSLPKHITIPNIFDSEPTSAINLLSYNRYITFYKKCIETPSAVAHFVKNQMRLLCGMMHAMRYDVILCGVVRMLCSISSHSMQYHAIVWCYYTNLMQSNAVN